MYTLALATLLFLAQDTPPASGTPQPATPPNLPTSPKVLTDGQWTVVHAEINGQPLADAKNNTVTVRGDMLTYMHEGKQHTVRLEFGANNTVRAHKMAASTGTPADANKDQGQRAGQGEAAAQPGQGQPAAGSTAAGQEVHQGVYISGQDVFCVCLYNVQNNGEIRRTGATEIPGRAGADSGSTRSGAGGQGAGNNTGGVAEDRPVQAAGNIITQGKMVLILRKGGAEAPAQGRPDQNRPVDR